MLLNLPLGILTGLSLALGAWQWLAGRRFPLRRSGAAVAEYPGITLLKPLKGCDAFSERCLESWFAQEYPGPLHILFGVVSPEDPVCPLVLRLKERFPAVDARLVVCGPPSGANAKVSKLAILEPLAKHEVLVISDADVKVPAGLLVSIAERLAEPETGLVNCFYQLANPSTLAMHCEAVAINADFWSQVLQSISLKPMDFVLGAVMAVKRGVLAQVGGFDALRDCLADDYQLGHRVAGLGYRVRLSPAVVECWDGPMGWAKVWAHQLRWARTIRVCQPVPYFLSILSNATFWPLLWAALSLQPAAVAALGLCGAFRIVTARDLQRRFTGEAPRLKHCWLPLMKDLLQVLLWAGAFAGNSIEWRGEKMRLRRDGTLVRPGSAVQD